jgi:hypothetical protein
MTVAPVYDHHAGQQGGHWMSEAETPGTPSEAETPTEPTEPSAPVETPSAPARKTADERKAMLARTVSNEVREGWRIESQTDYDAYLVKGQHTSHVLHLILTIITLGAWGIVWIVMAYLNRTQRETINVDEWGNLSIQK